MIQYGYWSYQGRIGRKIYIRKYLLRSLAIFALALALPCLLMLAKNTFYADAAGNEYNHEKHVLDILIIFACLFFVPLFTYAFWIFLAGQMKRLHDIGKSGKYAFFNFIPIAGSLILLALNIFKIGDKHTNEYGHNPVYRPSKRSRRRHK